MGRNAHLIQVKYGDAARRYLSSDEVMGGLNG